VTENTIVQVFSRRAISVAEELGMEEIGVPLREPPVIVTLEPVTAPASVTLKGAVALFAKVSPAQNLTSSPPVTVEASPMLFAASLT